MAGGMSRGGGIPLRDRVRSGGESGDAALGRAEEKGGRHCWVVDSPGHPGRWPGVLVEWRQDAAGWKGLVAYVVPGVAGPGVRLVMRWVAAAHLEQVLARNGP
jgi:hypothetical protein